MNVSKKESWFNERKPNLIQRFFIICSGADKSIIEECPTEWNKFTGIGATIFFTGLLASLSGGYALYTIFRVVQLDDLDKIKDVIDTNALWFAVPFGLLWGAIIFNLDRFIVSTFHKSNETKFWEKLGREFLQASPRILLAVIIAITISKPIEIKIFESRLAEQIQRNEIAAKKINIDDFSAVHGLAAKEERVKNLDTTISKLQTELETDPQNVKNLINIDLVQAKKELTSIINTNDPKIKVNENERYSISKNPNSYIYTTDSLGNSINTGNYTQAAKNKRSVLSQEIHNLKKEIEKKQKSVTDIEKQIKDERKSYQYQKTQEITVRKIEKDSANVQLTTSTAIAGKEAEKANKISEKAFTNNFITQIEALGNLTNSDKTMWWTSLMITLLFLTIELAPILTKLITKRGVYDEMLERIEYENMIKQKEIISRKNSEINELLRRAEEAAKLSGDVMLQKTKDKLDAELKSNKVILDTIAKYQQELALMTLEEWYKVESAKISATNIKTKMVVEN